MTAIIPIHRGKMEELKHLMKEGMHLLEEMCEETQMGERNYGERDMDYPYGDRMGMRNYPMSPYGDRWEAYGDRRGVRGTGRYSRY